MNLNFLGYIQLSSKQEAIFTLKNWDVVQQTWFNRTSNLTSPVHSLSLCPICTQLSARRLQLCQGSPVLLRFTPANSPQTNNLLHFQISLQKTDHRVWGIIFIFLPDKYSCSIDFQKDFSSKNV